MARSSMKALTIEAERAERARATRDTAVVSDAIAAGHALLDRARSGVKEGQQAGFRRDVLLRGWHAKAEAEWTRLQGNSSPAHWQTAVEAFSFGRVYAVARCRWRLAEAFLGAGAPKRATKVARAGYETAVRVGAAPLRVALEALAPWPPRPRRRRTGPAQVGGIDPALT
jgi:hypothetical protein